MTKVPSFTSNPGQTCLLLSFCLAIQMLAAMAFTSNCINAPYNLQKTVLRRPQQQTQLFVASSIPPPGADYSTLGNVRTTSTSSSSYVRWNSKSNATADVWELQTAVTTFQRIHPETKQAERIELHAQVHYGSHDYFDFYNSPDLFLNQHDEVLYELLVDESLLALGEDQSGRVLKEKLMASPNDQSLARGYGWQCQVDVIDYTHKQWKHADFTRQELLKEQQQQQKNTAQSATTSNSDQPLWQQVSSSGNAFWEPALAALLVGPPSLFVASGTDRNAATRKLFTNLFLPGNELAGWLRAMLWMTVPAPEISVLLLDWSSLFMSKSSARFSPVTLPILQSIMTLQLSQLRQLVFGQVIVAGNSAQQQQQQQNQDWNLLVTQRNNHALQVLESSLRRSSSSDPSSSRKSKRLALLYGCSHCPDLASKLVRDFGFSHTKTEWRSAWSVSVPTTFATGKEKIESDDKIDDSATTVGMKEEASIWEDLYSYLPPTAWAALLVLFPMYLAVGAVDWIDTIHTSFVSLLDENDALSFCGDWTLYLLRRVLLYVGVSKFALEWQDPNSNNR